MKKNLYFRQNLRRTNAFKEFVLSFFLDICSWPRLILEVFIRKNFGERYFTLYTVFGVAVFLLIIPMLPHWISNLIDATFGNMRGLGGFSRKPPIDPYAYQYGDLEQEIESGFDWGGFFTRYGLWYLFLASFLYASWQRYLEVKRNPSVFDFARFSLSAGNVNERFILIRDSNDNPDWRTIQTLIEPAPFFIVGLILWLIGQPLGILLVFCSVVYCFSYLGAYYIGDNFIMDKIDELICNEELGAIYIDDTPPANSKGLWFYGRKPADKNLRRELVGFFTEEEASKVE